MTLPLEGAPADGVAKLIKLEADARDLAAAQTGIARAPRALTRFLAPTSVARALLKSQTHLASVTNGTTALPKAAEWFLDNYYLIRRVARQVEEELPRGFVRHLPRLISGADKGLLRIDALGRAFVKRSKIELDSLELQRFIAAYQEIAPLTIAELWALPTFLRAAVLQHLLSLLAAMHVPALERDPIQAEEHNTDPEGVPETLSLDPSAGVERCVHALRLLDSIDWKVFFEKANRVEAILRKDPAGVYTRMDFATCDAYRKAVEGVAWAAGHAEAEVAQLAVNLAVANRGDERRGHVGFYLVDVGRDELEAQVGQRLIGLERLQRALKRFPTAWYLFSLLFLTFIPLAALGWRLRHGAHPLAIALAMLVAVLPFSMVGAAFLHSAFARLLPPRTLPKLDFTKGIPKDIRTLVAIPALLSSQGELDELLQQLELHYLSNPDPALQFALLTDSPDAKTKEGDPALLEAAVRGITALNTRHGANGSGPFHLLHRQMRWNPGEGQFMGWERKRGKLEELNRLLRGDDKTSYLPPTGDPAGLANIRYVITLDSDTQLPMGSAGRLVGLLAHPLNKAVFDARTGRVTAGYSIVQPRIETSPTSSRLTAFSRIFAGDIGFDIYTHAVSELYQDLFGSGIYVGKGIYDLDAFMRSVEGRVPENTLVSHDLFEGIHGRAALASDIVLYEGYPASYAAYIRRMHRWVRGDWQLLPWLFPRVPDAKGGRIKNTLAPIDRWKIFDNLRRSLVGPLTVLFIPLSFFLPGPPLLWIGAALATLVGPLLPGILFARGQRKKILARAVLAIVFLASEACLVVDALVRVLVRRAITKKLMLQWTTAAQVSKSLANQSQRALFWRTLLASPILASLLAAAVFFVRPAEIFAALPICLLWFFAPEIAFFISEPDRARREPLDAESRKKLRLLARRTWRFFETFVGPNDQWLPVDNYQEEPNEQTAHRTSPTNIGLMLLSTVSAVDYGYIGLSEMMLRLRRSFDSIARLPHYQGHLLNWYETKNLQPLLPRYVSTVDSGNFAGCLIALAQACRELVSAPVIRESSWLGLEDSLELLSQVLESAPNASLDPLHSVLEQMRQAIEQAKGNLGDSSEILQRLEGGLLAELDRSLYLFLQAGAQRHDASLLHELRVSLESFRQQVHQMSRELDTLLPWLSLRADAQANGLTLPWQLPLDGIPDAAVQLQGQLDASLRAREAGAARALDASASRLSNAFRRARESSAALRQDLLSLAQQAEAEMRGMDFHLLFDDERKLFHIGFNVTVDQHDPHYYDLLASEARLASYLAIVKREAPESHWYALGRPMARLRSSALLLSWGGTMFEYLMPALLMRSHEGTLLANTYEQVVQAQIDYARKKSEPWGISESAYARLDAHQTYQYRSFGVPGLGFKRGLEDDRVITPYASMLAVAVRPHEVVANLELLERMDMLGTYGLFEALDLTPERIAEGRQSTVVRSYMAHHQGMLFIAVGNLVNPRSMVERFHKSSMVETGEVLLNEHAPDSTPREWPLAEPAESATETQPALPRPPEPWNANDRDRLQAWTLTNGRMSSLLTDGGGGGLYFEGVALTRYLPDSTRADQGLWIYMRDEEAGRVWVATSPQGRTTCSMNKVEFHRREEGISVHVDVAVAPADDVEIRQITLHNETDRPRRFTVTSAGQPVLLDAKQAPAHPAFSSMFLESERLDSLEGLLFARRTQSVDEDTAVLVHRLVHAGSGVSFAGIETERGAFYGRTARSHCPQALAHGAVALNGTVGPVLDPIFSVMARVELKPKSSVTFAFATTFARSRSAAVELAQRYGTMHAVRWAFRDAEQEIPRRLQRTHLEPSLVPAMQRLLSALIFSDPSMRAPNDGVDPERPSQQRLWARGISGDDPILLVRVREPAAQIVGECLAAQRYLRLCGMRIDLVLLDEKASGYQSEGSGTMQSVLAQNEASEWLNQKGGIFIVAADQIALEERRHLEACARVMLDTNDGSLAQRMFQRNESAPKLPRFAPMLAEDSPAARPPERSKRLFDNGIGGFSEDGREYLITVTPGKPLPAPWANVIANPELGCLASESSLGASWSLNSGENRLTPWRNDSVFDPPSEALYLRDEETAAVWTPTPLPAGRESEMLVRHGAGYTSYEHESRGLAQKLTVFAPPDAPLKIVRLKLRNTSSRQRRLTATYYAEWVLGTRRENTRPNVLSELDSDNAALFASCSWSDEFKGRAAFLASERRIHGFTTDRAEFLGLHGELARPDSLERWGLSGSLTPGVDPCAALQVHLELKPGEEIETHFLLGEAASPAEAKAAIQRYRNAAEVDAAFARLTVFWDDLLETVRVKTPEPAMDLMLNRWLLYQALTARIFGRTGFYQSSGAFGFRDQLQDILALLQSSPDRARAHILETAKHQFEEGDVLHWWHPPSGRGVRTHCSDDLAWLPYVTSAYVQATGDAQILQEPIGFLKADPLKPDEPTRYAQFETSPLVLPLLEHCKRALTKADTAGLHGLPLMGDGDWNDGMNRIGSEGRGESVWLAWFLCSTMDRFAKLLMRVQDSEGATHWRERASALRAQTQAVAWDGDWYLRAFHDDGSLVGSANSGECQIDSIAQSWAVLSSDGEADARAQKALAAADRQLVNEKDRLGLLFTPPFDSTLHDPGYIRGYPPGVRENGGQYTHGATWLGFAHAAMRDGEGAEKIFQLLNPILHSTNAAEAALYRIEPYVLAGDVYSCAPWVGRGGWSWYTGSAAWLWRLGAEEILGIRKIDGQLRIDPCIPPAWKGFEAWIRLGKQRIHVVVENPHGVSTGIASRTLDGVAIAEPAMVFDASSDKSRELVLRMGVTSSS